jgi:hypothetical protein
VRRPLVQTGDGITTWRGVPSLIISIGTPIKPA